MPEIPARHRRSVATLTSATVIGASVAVLLVSPVSTTAAHAAVAPGSTLRASVNTNGTEARQGGSENAISADGNSIAFVSTGQLDDLPTNGRESIYVRDLVKNKTVMISRGQFTPPPPPTNGPGFGSTKLLNLSAAQPTTPERAPDGQSFDPSLSANGRFVAFMTTAHNIVHDDLVNQDIVVVDRDPNGDGVYDEDKTDPTTGSEVRDYKYFWISDSQFNTNLSEPKLSADAGRIVWHEQNFADGISDRLRTAVLQNGARFGEIQQVPVNLGTQLRSFAQFDPAISGDGKHIVMHANMTVQCDGCAPDFHAIVSTDISTGVSTRVDFDPDLKPISEDFTMFVMHPSVNFDGTVISFEGEQFTDNDGSFFSTFNQPNVYAVRVDYGAGKVTNSVIASQNNAGGRIDGASPAVSADGRYVAFETDSQNAHDGADGPVSQDDTSCIKPPQVIGLTGSHPLDFSAKLPPERTPNPPRTACQVVLRDLVINQTNTLISVNVNGAAGGSDSSFPSITADGGRIGFDSAAGNLVAPPDSNDPTTDVFVRTLQPGIQADPENFGTVEIGQSVNRSIQLNETGNGPLVIEQVVADGVDKNDFTVDPGTCIGQALHQTGSCRVSVSFSPKATGNRNGLVRIQVRGGQQFRVVLTGVGSAQPVPRGPEFLAAPGTLDFGQRLLLSNGPEQTVTVTNTGDQPLRITAVGPVGPSAPGDYTVSRNTCFTNLASKAQCQVSVKFSPSLPGDRPAVLQFTDNAIGGVHLVNLRGQGGLMTITVNPGVMPGGRVTAVLGVGFPPGKNVTVTFQQRVGQSTATVAADGTFRASLLVFPKASPETRTVVATVDGSPALFATTPLLIVFDTVKPADFVLRH